MSNPKKSQTLHDLTKQVYSDMQVFAGRYGENVSKVYTSLIDYMIGFFDFTGRKNDGWSYNEEQNKHFMEMTKDVVVAVEKGIEKNGWYDIFGDIFMTYMAEKGRLGQCFTPEGVSNLCAQILYGKSDKYDPVMPCRFFGRRHIVSDPTCGSGRLVLAGALESYKQFQEYPYVICEDIDSTCVKQTAINLCLHGWYGEVVCHNTLKEPDGLRFGFIVNEGIHPFRDGIPTVRYSTNPEEFVCIKFWKSKKQEHDRRNN